MSLTQQFLIISILPLSFLGMGLYLRQSGLKRHELLQRWTYALVAVFVWATSVLRFYGGTTFPLSVTFTWGVVGKYAFSLTAVAILLATFSHLSIPRRHGQFSINLSLALIAIMFIFDYQIWPYQLPEVILAGQPIRHFDVWTAVWIASWLVPALAAWMLTQQVRASFPDSLYRNQMHYWLLVLVLFIIGGSLASIQQPGQPGWQEAGLLFVIIAFLAGTISIAQSHLPDLQLALRQLLVRLSGAIIVFVISWLTLFGVMTGVTNLREDTSPNLFLVLAAGFVAGFFMLVYRLVNELMRRLFLTGRSRREMALANYQDATAHFSEPEKLAQFFLHIIQSELGTEDAWFFVTEEGPAAKLVLRPLASLNDDIPSEAITFEGDSLFTAYLRENKVPLVQYDIDTLSSFDGMLPEEKALLTDWKRVLYVPLHAGSRLMGLLALGEKSIGQAYDRRDFQRLQALSPQISPLLAQAKNLASLRRVNDYVFGENQALTYEKQYLHEQLKLYERYISLVSPELRRPFIPISQKIEQIQAGLEEREADQAIATELSQEVEKLRLTLEQLIMIAGRIQAQGEFIFQQTDLDEITHQAINKLNTMAEARRVQVKYHSTETLPKVMGDAGRLQEAIQHLLHNAIKFNKIGGSVHLTYDLKGDQVCLRMSDTGVGIPQERMETLWQGFPQIQPNGSSRSPGLGLTLTQYIVAAHGGRLEADSQYGSGTVFSVYLPIAFDE